MAGLTLPNDDEVYKFTKIFSLLTVQYVVHVHLLPVLSDPPCFYYSVMRRLSWHILTLS